LLKSCLWAEERAVLRLERLDLQQGEALEVECSPEKAADGEGEARSPELSHCPGAMFYWDLRLSRAVITVAKQ
jgi:hypothetical protein